MALFLLEIGTEELPADFARLSLSQLRECVSADLESDRLPYRELRVTSTPRRLVVWVDGLPARQEDTESEHKGPPAQQAFRDGQPTPAAVGFARRCGLPVDQLEVRDTPKGPFVFARTRQPGRATADLLGEHIPGWIWGLQGRRFMRWGDGEARFSRPVRWLLALLDADVIPVVLRGCDPLLRSDRLSRGHRLRPEPLPIANAASYDRALAGADVLADRTERAAVIQEQLQKAAVRHQAQLELPTDLFEELVDLVESPWVIEGELDPVFLSLPPEVISTVMRTHQRYVPLRRRDVVVDPLALDAHAFLMSKFLVVSNGRREAEDTIRQGNQRVLRARLADAAFFLKTDQALKSIDRREALSKVTFAEGLGSLRDRTERIEWCTDVLLEMLALPDDVAHASRRAAHLCKHDLVSQMVGEFPELQGIIGAKYLLAEKESHAVATAVLEHYQPRASGDAPPGSAGGAVVALAERLELLLSIFSIGERPSGSSDPYGLRRAGNGIIQILRHHQWHISLSEFCHRAANQWQMFFPGLDPESLESALVELLKQRLSSLLEEESIDADVIAATLNSSLITGHEIDYISQVRDRAHRLQSLRQKGRLHGIQSIVQRASRLTRNSDLESTLVCPEGVIKPKLFEKESEINLYELVQSMSPFAQKIESFDVLLAHIEGASLILAQFFDGPDSVMVLCEDLGRRVNRIRLLTLFSNQASCLAAFDKLFM